MQVDTPPEREMKPPLKPQESLKSIRAFDINKSFDVGDLQCPSHNRRKSHCFSNHELEKCSTAFLTFDGPWVQAQASAREESRKSSKQMTISHK